MLVECVSEEASETQQMYVCQCVWVNKHKQETEQMYELMND